MKNIDHNYSIGVVTYINRYYTYFKPNIESLIKNFPDKEIICIINGHPDKTKNISYLKEITSWLSTLENVKYITFEDHQSLAKCWNWILLMSSSQNNLFLNDDISVKREFRKDFEIHLSKKRCFFAINNSFSHFVLNKDVVKKIGWFDERFLGVGQEDGDYLLRLFQGGINLVSLPCKGIINFVAHNENPGWQKISSTTDSKYSSINKEFMNKKWASDTYNNGKKHEIEFIWNNHEFKASLREDMETPMFYDYILLDNNLKFASNSKTFQYKIKDYKRTIKTFLKNIKFINKIIYMIKK